MKKEIKIILFIVIFAVAGIVVAGMIKFNIIGDDVYIATEGDNSLSSINLDEYVFNTEDGKMGILSYASADKNNATLIIDDIAYQLKKIESATGLKYASEDNSVVFSDTDNKITIEINGQTSYKVAEFILIDDLDETTRRRVEVLKSNKEGDPDANKYDFGSDGIDNENCGEGTTMEDGECAIDEDTDDDSWGDNGSAEERLDSDDDGDSILTEDEANSEVCNDVDNDCDNPYDETDAASDIYIKLDDVKGEVDDGSKASN